MEEFMRDNGKEIRGMGEDLRDSLMEISTKANTKMGKPMAKEFSIGAMARSMMENGSVE
jgi:hypothetical protein